MIKNGISIICNHSTKRGNFNWKSVSLTLDGNMCRKKTYKHHHYLYDEWQRRKRSVEREEKKYGHNQIKVQTDIFLYANLFKLLFVCCIIVVVFGTKHKNISHRIEWAKFFFSLNGLQLLNVSLLVLSSAYQWEQLFGQIRNAKWEEEEKKTNHWCWRAGGTFLQFTLETHKSFQYINHTSQSIGRECLQMALLKLSKFLDNSFFFCYCFCCCWYRSHSARFEMTILCEIIIGTPFDGRDERCLLIISNWIFEKGFEAEHKR